MFELILELCIEILIWVGGEFFFEAMARFFGFETRAKAEADDDDYVIEPTQRWIVLFVLGVVIGVIVTLVKPESIVRKPVGRIFNLVLSPLAAGTMTHLFAKFLERFDKKPNLFADFMCGASFAFGLVLYRYIATT